MSEEQVCKEIIEQVGYQEFYRYFQEKTTLIEQQRKEIERLREENKKIDNIIEAIEKALKDNIEELKDLTFSYDRIYEDKEILKLIQELKGSDKE